MLVVVFIFGDISSTEERDSKIEEWMAKEWVVFSDDLESTENVTYMTAEEISEYKPQTEIYSSQFYYDKLDENQKIVYKAYLYALDKNYAYTYIDNALLQGDLSSQDILVMLSLDTGFLQQNIDVQPYTATQILNSNIMFKQVKREVQGDTMHIKNFSQERTERVKEAAEKLKAVDFDFPKNATDKEKARIIYDYVGEQLVYAEKYDNTDAIAHSVDYLCEAVDTGETNCDGFANMFTMLCNINGIRCFEKSSDDKRDEVGHTWNVAHLDGKWYNVDCTEAIGEDEKENHYVRDVLFGFSDELQEYDVIYKDMQPDCNSNILDFKGRFSKYNSDVVDLVSNELSNTPDAPVYIYVKAITEGEIDALAERVVNRIYASIIYNIIDISEGAVICFERK